MKVRPDVKVVSFGEITSRREEISFEEVNHNFNF
jgi:hypothetical protein